MRGIGIGGESGSSGHTTPGSEGSLRGRFNWAPSGGLNGGSTAYVRNELINRVPRAVRTVRLRKPALQVQQGGISVDKALVESLPSLTRALMERRFMSFVHTIFHFN